MSSGRQRAQACISLAAYVLALAAGLFHQHAHHGHAHSHVTPADAPRLPGAACTESHARHARCTHGHVAERHAEGSAASRRSPASTPCDDHSSRSSHGDSPPHQHEDCPVCQFLALKQIPAAAPLVIADCAPVAETIDLFAAPLPHPRAWRPLSRGPPA